MAQRIDFHFNVPNRLLYACRVVRKARANNMTVAVWTRDAHRLDFFVRQLWSFEPTGFYPHVAADDELAAETPGLLLEPQSIRRPLISPEAPINTTQSASPVYYYDIETAPGEVYELCAAE